MTAGLAGKTYIPKLFSFLKLFIRVLHYFTEMWFKTYILTAFSEKSSAFNVKRKKTDRLYVFSIKVPVNFICLGIKMNLKMC